MYLDNVHYSNSTFFQVLLFRVKSLRKYYCIKLDNQEIDIIVKKFIQKFGTNYLYYSQIESPLTQLLKPYVLHTIRNIRNMIRPYVKEIKEIIGELEINLPLERYKDFYIKIYEEFVKTHFIYPSIFEDQHDKEKLEYYKEFLFSLKKVSLTIFCDNLFEINNDLAENKLYYFLFNRFSHLDTKMKFRKQCYQKAHSLLYLAEKEPRNIVEKTDGLSDLIKSKIIEMDPLYLEKKFIELELDSQFIKEFRNFIPLDFWKIPGYNHFELIAKAIKENINNPAFLDAFKYFTLGYYKLKEFFKTFNTEVSEEPEENFYHNIIIQKYYIALLKEIGWNENEIIEFLNKKLIEQDKFILKILLEQKDLLYKIELDLEEGVNKLLFFPIKKKEKQKVIDNTESLKEQKDSLLPKEPSNFKESKTPNIQTTINPSDLVLEIPSSSKPIKGEFEFEKYQSNKFGKLDVSTGDFSHTREIGNWGEKYIYELLSEKYCGNPDVKIIWNNEFGESKKPFDILLTINKDDYFVEVKASITSENRFTISGNEFNFAKDKKDRHWLFLVINAGTENPMHTKIVNIYQKYRSNLFKLSSITLSF